ncbi:unnamed protein product [Diplocarpon coronariae]
MFPADRRRKEGRCRSTTAAPAPQPGSVERGPQTVGAFPCHEACDVSGRGRAPTGCRRAERERERERERELSLRRRALRRGENPACAPASASGEGGKGGFFLAVCHRPQKLKLTIHIIMVTLILVVIRPSATMSPWLGLRAVFCFFSPSRSDPSSETPPTAADSQAAPTFSFA